MSPGQNYEINFSRIDGNTALTRDQYLDKLEKQPEYDPVNYAQQQIIDTFRLIKSSNSYSLIKQAAKVLEAWEQEWTSEAACKGLDANLFFAPSYHETELDKNKRVKAAKAVCNLCTVRPQCLAWALSQPEKHGIWGGLTENERRKLKR